MSTLHTITLVCGGERIQVPVTTEAVSRFERITGCKFEKLTDHPKLADLLPCWIWCVAVEWNPAITAQSIMDLWAKREDREAAAQHFRQAARPNFNPTNN